MLAIARTHPDPVEWVADDALLATFAPDRAWAGLLARFSIVHVDPVDVTDVLAAWWRRVAPGGVLLVAFQALPEGVPGHEPFLHPFAPAWRWSADTLSDELRHAGFVEGWRMLRYPGGDRDHPECHLLAHRLPDPAVGGAIVD